MSESKKGSSSGKGTPSNTGSTVDLGKSIGNSLPPSQLTVPMPTVKPPPPPPDKSKK